MCVCVVRLLVVTQSTDIGQSARRASTVCTALDSDSSYIISWSFGATLMQKYSDIRHRNMTLWTLADGVSRSSVWICRDDMTWNIKSNKVSLIGL